MVKEKGKDATINPDVVEDANVVKQKAKKGLMGILVEGAENKPENKPENKLNNEKGTKKRALCC
tara:strand:- start:889 stop:1080 length:192 start_codon:yes stop_codon:yes gene_type:complete